MQIDLDFDFDYLRIHFLLDNISTDFFYCSNFKVQFFAVLDLQIEFSINNNDWFGEGREFGFKFSNLEEEMTIAIWKKYYVFDIPRYIFVSKTKEYVDHFNWIKEAYVA